MPDNTFVLQALKNCSRDTEQTSGDGEDLYKPQNTQNGSIVGDSRAKSMKSSRTEALPKNFLTSQTIIQIKKSGRCFAYVGTQKMNFPDAFSDITNKQLTNCISQPLVAESVPVDVLLQTSLQIIVLDVVIEWMVGVHGRGRGHSSTQGPKRAECNQAQAFIILVMEERG